MKDLIDNLKDNNQDFEFYPTTSKMISDIVNHIGSHNFKHGTILDIGAGNGNFFTKLSKICDTSCLTQFAIEKSQILINQMPNDIIIIGADFYQQTLIDKDFDLIFCNPPYREFKGWMEKVISETNCNKVVFIVPERWQEDSRLVELVKKRGFEYKIISSDDFLDGERQARAKVNIIYFTRTREQYDYTDGNINKAFVDFFEENFSKFKKEKEQEFNIDERMENELVAGSNLIERMCNLYNLEFQSLIDTFQSISKIDIKTLENIGIDRIKVMNCLYTKIKELKKEYWMHLIHNLKEVKERLIYKFSSSLISSITLTIGNIDFNEENCYAILIWIIKNANKYINEQLLFMFDLCIQPTNIKKYKSNKLVFETEQRRWGQKEVIFKNKKEVKNITLDYRIITDSTDYDIYTSNYKRQAIINSWEAICNNLLGHTNFGDIKFFKNGNVHLKFNTEFSKAFNIQASLLKGWIKDKRQAMNEFEMDVKEEDLNFTYFNFTNKNQLLIE